MPTDPIRDRLSLAIAAAQEAGEMTLKWYQNPALHVDEKPDGSPVTPADKEAERIIRAAIAREFAGDAILGEEQGDTSASGAQFRFIIDPIDGTRSFAAGLPTYGVLIGVQQVNLPQPRIVAGVAHFPALRETIWASARAGCWWRTATGETRRAEVREPSAPGAAHVQTTSPQSYRKHRREAALPALAAATGRFHGWNDAYSFALVATGRAHGVVGFGFSIWDVAPFAIAIEEAGGMLTDWQGGDVTRNASTLVGGAPAAYQHLRSVLAPFAQ
jgi:histidinol phosphatase-like enzyme (inositol monophosphatase family)